jgi:hypothetical protein
MGFWKKFKKALHIHKRHNHGHPTIFQVLKHDVKNFNRNIKKIGKVADKAIDFVSKNTKLVKTIVEVTADVASVVATAAGQPELVVAIQGAKTAAEKGLKAIKDVKEAKDQVKVLTTAVAHKESVSSLLRKSANLAAYAAKHSGNKEHIRLLNQYSKNVHVAADITDKSIEHSKVVKKIVKGSIIAIKHKDTKRGMAIIKTAVVEGKSIAKDIKQIKLGEKLDTKIIKVKNNKVVKKVVKVVKKISKDNTVKAVVKVAKKELIKRIDEESKPKTKVKKTRKPRKPRKKKVSIDDDTYNINISGSNNVINVEDNDNIKNAEPVKVDKKELKKKIKKKRKPSAYNLFMSKKRKEGLSMKEISVAWKKHKVKK